MLWQVNDRRKPVACICLAVLVAICAFSGCGSYNIVLERKVSGDGAFWATVNVNRSSAVAGGDWYWIEVGKSKPTWRDSLTRNKSEGICSLSGPGKLSISWTGSRQLQVVCTNCRQGSFSPISKEWEGVAIQYAFDSGAASASTPVLTP
jgi:hypothetical protein